jgi:hypothetical protein
MEVTFEEHFKRPDLADADIVIIHRSEADDGASRVACSGAQQAEQQQQQQQQQQQCKELATFPVHQLFLLKSDFFKAQVKIAAATTPYMLAGQMQGVDPPGTQVADLCWKR